MRATRGSLSGYSLQLCAPCRKDWLSVRKEALVSLADAARRAPVTQPPHRHSADPGLVLVRGPDRPGLQDERKGWIMSVRLTDAQLVMMTAAAQRKDRCLSAPETMKGAALSKVSAKFMKLGLVREIRAKHGSPVWRRDDARQGYALKLTAAGLKAIAVDEGSDGAIEPSKATQPQAKNAATGRSRRTRKMAAPREGSKLAQVIELLQRADGATIPLDFGDRMVAAYDAGGAYRATQTRICRGPQTDRH